MALRAAIARWLVPGSRSSAASTANSFFVIKTEHPFMADSDDLDRASKFIFYCILKNMNGMFIYIFYYKI